jgi:hypothetical protein
LSLKSLLMQKRKEKFLSAGHKKTSIKNNFFRITFRFSWKSGTNLKMYFWRIETIWCCFKRKCFSCSMIVTRKSTLERKYAHVDYFFTFLKCGFEFSFLQPQYVVKAKARSLNNNEKSS